MIPKAVFRFSDRLVRKENPLQRYSDEAKSPAGFPRGFLFARRHSAARQRREPGIHIPSAAIMDSGYLALLGPAMTEKRAL
jgi:hypothetical protein